MADPHIRAAFYLSPTVDALWRWTGDGQVLTWPDDTTIAFRAEVEAVLKRLAPGGFPPFGAVALLLAACREGWMQSLGRQTVAGYVLVFGGMHTSTEGRQHATQLVYGMITGNMELLLEGLDAVNRLPRQQIESVAAKALLAEVVFETVKNRSSPDDARVIDEALEQGIHPETLRPQLSSEESLAQFIRQVDGLHAGLQRVDSAALALRAETGLDSLVQPAPDELAPPDAVRRLLAELAADHELAGLAKLAHDLMAAVSVPRSLRTRDELSVGGVSDLTNRGPLDRLLVSELAHDDLTLAVRVAVNEALYLRRESPPREPPHRRAILIDAGVRMWGVPRVFATAVALALAATSDPKAELAVFRAAGDGIEPVDLTHRAGIEAHLGALETAPHPAGALDAFHAAAAATDGGQTDVVLVTHADVLADPEFSAALRASRIGALYLAAIDREGSFSLFVHSRAGRKLVREAKLSLAAIDGRTPPKTRKPAGVPLINAEKDPSLPAILYSEPFPFFLPGKVEPRYSAVSTRHGLVAAVRDGRLLQWRDGKHGARQLSALLPVGRIHGVFIDEDEETAMTFVTSKRDPVGHLVTANLQTGQVVNRNLVLRRVGAPIGAFVHRSLFFIVYANLTDAFALGTGNQVASRNFPSGTHWHGGRFYRDSRGFSTIGYDGSNSLTLLRIPDLPADTVSVFDREGYDGAWAVRMPGGRLKDPSQNEYDLFQSLRTIAKAFHGVSPSGHRLAFDSSAGGVLVDLQTAEKPRDVGNAAVELLAPQIDWSFRSPVHCRMGFSGIFEHTQLRLSLMTRRSECFSFDLDSAGNLALVREGFCGSPPDGLRTFGRMKRAPGMRLGMAEVSWNDGSKAWLDSRGLLHLRSSDRAIPEMSITLTNIGPAAWSADGNVTGPAYLLGERPTAEGWYFNRMLRQFVARLR